MPNNGEERERDFCPDCGGVGEFLGETRSEGPSVGHGSPTYTEHYRCLTKYCDREWSV